MRRLWSPGLGPNYDLSLTISGSAFHVGRHHKDTAVCPFYIMHRKLCSISDGYPYDKTAKDVFEFLSKHDYGRELGLKGGIICSLLHIHGNKLPSAKLMRVALNTMRRSILF